MSVLGLGRRGFVCTVLLTFGLVVGGCSEDKSRAPVAPEDASRPPEDASRPPETTPSRDSGGDAVTTKPGGEGDAGEPTATPPVEDDLPDGPIEWTTTIPLAIPAPRATIASGDSVFFVGNSFFASWDRKLPDWVSAIGKQVSPPIDIKTASYIVPGNQKLSWFLKQPESQAALKSRKFKVFVIQPEEREPVDDTANFKQAVRDWNKAIVASGAKTMLFMTWDLSAEKGTTFFKRLATAFDEIGAELRIPVIPVGLIYDDCNKDPFPGQTAGSYWLTGGELHQTETGSAVNAYATFAMLTGINPGGCAINAPNNTNSPEMLQYLSNRTWRRVAIRLKQ
jgi:hypothetical protein